MKKKSILVKVLFIGLITTKILATEEISNYSVNACIDRNSGAGGVDCLENLYNKGKKVIHKKESEIKVVLKQRHQNDDLGEAHYEGAIENLEKSSKDFKNYSDKTCLFDTYSAGGVASGASLVYYRCLIEQNNLRIKVLNRVLSYK